MNDKEWIVTDGFFGSVFVSERCGDTVCSVFGNTVGEEIDRANEIVNAKYAFDHLDEIMHLMRPRYCGDVDMGGRYPCWFVWLPSEGSCERKSLRTAVLECAELLKKIESAPNPPRSEIVDVSPGPPSQMYRAAPSEEEEQP